MNKHQLAAMGALKGALGEVTQSPMIKLALRYWWLSVPVGMALYGRYKARKKEDNEYKLYQAFDDFGMIMGPVMTFVGLSELANQMEAQGKLDRPTSIRDVEYQRVEQPPLDSQSQQEQQL